MKKFVALLAMLVVICWTVGAMAISASEFPANVSELPELPMSIDDLPEILYGIGEETLEDGRWTVTLSGDPFVNNFEDGENKAFADVGIAYQLDGEVYEMWYLDSDSEQEGNTFYFILPEGAEVIQAIVDINYVQDGESYYISRTANGLSEAYYFGDNYTCQYYFSEENKLYAAYYYDYDSETNAAFSSANFNFDEETGNLISYRVPVEQNYYIEYDVEGTATSAFCYVADEENYYWLPDVGWHHGDYYDENGNYFEMVPCDAPEGVKDPTEYEAPYPVKAVKADRTWYPNNTVGVLGLSLRDDLGMSDKWYNVIPVDLTVQGRQTVRLVASNLYYFGSATITVADGNVTVNYQLPRGNAYLKGECLQWFTSLDEITASFLNNPVGEYAFGEPVSISEQLNGQDVALLFICNHVTYRQPITYEGAMLTRYYRNRAEWVAWRKQLNELLNTME